MGSGRLSFNGRVVRGNGRGRELGCPTANLIVAGADELPRGVHAVEIQGATANHEWGVANIGRRPTFGGHELAIEIYLLDFTGDLYDRNLEVVLKQKLRDERAFTSADELVAQIRTDIQQARTLIAGWQGVAQLPTMEIEDVDNH